MSYVYTVENLDGNASKSELIHLFESRVGPVSHCKMSNHLKGQKTTVTVNKKLSSYMLKSLNRAKLRSKYIQVFEYDPESERKPAEPSQIRPPTTHRNRYVSTPSKIYGETYGLKEKFLKSIGIEDKLSSFVFVKHIKASEDQLSEVFRLAGNIIGIQIMSQSYDTDVKCVTIEYCCTLEAVQAVTMLNGQKLNGISMQMSMIPPPNHGLDYDVTKIAMHLLTKPIVLPIGLSRVSSGLGPGGRPMPNLTEHVQKTDLGKKNEYVPQVEEKRTSLGVKKQNVYNRSSKFEQKNVRSRTFNEVEDKKNFERSKTRELSPKRSSKFDRHDESSNRTSNVISINPKERWSNNMRNDSNEQDNRTDRVRHMSPQSQSLSSANNMSLMENDPMVSDTPKKEFNPYASSISNTPASGNQLKYANYPQGALESKMAYKSVQSFMPDANVVPQDMMSEMAKQVPIPSQSMLNQSQSTSSYQQLNLQQPQSKDLRDILQKSKQIANPFKKKVPQMSGNDRNLSQQSSHSFMEEKGMSRKYDQEPAPLKGSERPLDSLVASYQQYRENLFNQSEGKMDHTTTQPQHKFESNNFNDDLRETLKRKRSKQVEDKYARKREMVTSDPPTGREDYVVEITGLPQEAEWEILMKLCQPHASVSFAKMVFPGIGRINVSQKKDALNIFGYLDGTNYRGNILSVKIL